VNFIPCSHNSSRKKKTLPVVDAFNRYSGEGSGLGSVACGSLLDFLCWDKAIVVPTRAAPRHAVCGLAAKLAPHMHRAGASPAHFAPRVCNATDHPPPVA
jgi:hypothetical protein